MLVLDDKGKEEKGTSRSGFILFIVIILFIIGVGAIIAIPIMKNRDNNPGIGQCYSNMHTIGYALDMYATDNKFEYPQNMDMLTPKYIKNLPTCPLVGGRTYNYNYSYYNDPKDSSKNRYTFHCRGRTHGRYMNLKNYPADFPRYTNLKRLEQKP